MNEEYRLYLQCQQWKEKRERRLELSGRVCEVCGVAKNIQVHHLTYKRIFNEDMDDLMCLCRKHHVLIEKLIRKHRMERNGNVGELRKQVMALIRLKDKSMFLCGDEHVKPSNACQELLACEEWFRKACRLKYKTFKRVIKERINNMENRTVTLANAIAIYRRIKKTKANA